MKTPHLLAVLVLGAAGACVPAGNVGVKPGYDFSKLKKVAVVTLADGRGLRGSGRYVSDRVAHHLAAAGLPLMERGEVDKRLREQGLDLHSSIIKRRARKIGKMLGADAVVFGRLRSKVDTPRLRLHGPREKILVRRQGRFKQVTYERRAGLGDVKALETKDDVHLDVSIRMVDVNTGEPLFVLSAASDRRGFYSAAEAALNSLLKKVERRIRRSRKGERKSYYEKDDGGDPVIKGWRY